MPIAHPLLQAAVDSIADAKVRTPLSERVAALPADRQTSTANAIDLGGADAKERAAHAPRHAVMLGHLLLGMKVAANIANLKAVVGGWSAADCAKELEALRRSYTERLAEVAKAGGAGYFGSVVLGPSFYRYATSEEQRVARLAIQAAQEMALKATIAVATVRANATSETRSRYEAHFGAYDGARFTKVKGNIGLIYRALTTKPVLLYYRGPRVGGIDDSADNMGGASPASSVAETWTAAQITNAAGLHAYRTEAKCKEVLHVWMGTAAFTSAGGPSSTGGKRSVAGSMSVAGTILHELSHYACSTADEESPVCSWGASSKCYGATNVAALAAADTTKACNNADSYRYYFEAFQAV